MRRLFLAMLASLPATALVQVPFGPEFLVNAYTSEYQRYPNVGADDVGRFVVVWWRKATDEFEGSVHGQRYDPAGRRLGGEFQISGGTGAGDRPALAVSRDGSFVVVWSSSFEGLLARRFAASGAPLGAPFVVSKESNSYPFDVSPDPSGGFVVVWVADDGDYGGVVGRRFDGAGNPRGAEFRVNAYTTGRQRSPAVAVAPGGAFMVVWETRDPPPEDVAFGRLFDAQGAPLGPDFRVSAYTTGEQSVPDIGADGAGTYVVTWNDFDNRVGGGRRFNAAGSPVGAQFTIAPQNNYGHFSRARLAVDPAGAFTVVWLDYNSVYAKRFDTAGSPGASFRVDQRASISNFDPVPTTVPGNGLVVTWFERHVRPGILARRFADVGPSALMLDPPGGTSSDGNGVLEPGETIPVVPAWFNSTATPRPAAGTASEITGPGSPTLYGIADPTAAYGTLPPNGAASCAVAGNCYAVAVAVPPARPAAHWDARVREDLVAGALVPPHIWTLHVGDSFVDVPRSSLYYRFIEALLHHDVVTGCQAGLYCAQSVATREQMAVFVLAGLEPAWFRPDRCVEGSETFPDVPASSPFCPWIEELYRRNVVGGCSADLYCPTAPVTREQMSVFVLRTLDPLLEPPACTTPIFADVPASSLFCRWIEELARRGIVGGCGGGNYCPTAAVSREQMSVFITGTFGLTLYGP